MDRLICSYCESPHHKTANCPRDDEGGRERYETEKAEEAHYA